MTDRPALVEPKYQLNYRKTQAEKERNTKIILLALAPVSVALALAASPHIQDAVARFLYSQ